MRPARYRCGGTRPRAPEPAGGQYLPLLLLSAAARVARPHRLLGPGHPAGTAARHRRERTDQTRERTDQTRGQRRDRSGAARTSPSAARADGPRPFEQVSPAPPPPTNPTSPPAPAPSLSPNRCGAARWPRPNLLHPIAAALPAGPTPAGPAPAGPAPPGAHFSLFLIRINSCKC